MAQAPLSEEQEHVMQELQNRVVDLRKEVSAKRKAGGYTKIPELMLINIPAKLKMLTADFQQKDVEKVREMLRTIEEDLKVDYP